MERWGGSVRKRRENSGYTVTGDLVRSSLSSYCRSGEISVFFSPISRENLGDIDFYGRFRLPI